VDPGPYIVTSPENTYPRGKHGESKLHRSNACDLNNISSNALTNTFHPKSSNQATDYHGSATQ
jgi:hypothetical protein